MNILAIGAHPDDIELGCLGTLLKHVSEGHRVSTLTLSDGQGGNAPSHIRRSEARSLGLTVPYAKIYHGDILASNLNFMRQETIDFIERIIEIEKPEIVYCHSEHDRHQHHKIVAMSSAIATRFVDQVFSFELPSTLNGFNPNYFVDFVLQCNTKIELMKIFHSQKEKPYMQEEAIRSRALDWAVKSNMYPKSKAVEAFHVERFSKW